MGLECSKLYAKLSRMGHFGVKTGKMVQNRGVTGSNWDPVSFSIGSNPRNFHSLLQKYHNAVIFLQQCHRVLMSKNPHISLSACTVEFFRQNSKWALETAESSPKSTKKQTKHRPAMCNSQQNGSDTGIFTGYCIHNPLIFLKLTLRVVRCCKNATNTLSNCF